MKIKENLPKIYNFFAEKGIIRFMAFVHVILILFFVIAYLNGSYFGITRNVYHEDSSSYIQNHK